MQEPIDIKKLDKRILEDKNQIVSDQIMNTFFTVSVNCYSTRKIVTLIIYLFDSYFFICSKIISQCCFTKFIYV